MPMRHGRGARPTALAGTGPLHSCSEPKAEHAAVNCVPNRPIAHAARPSCAVKAALLGTGGSSEPVKGGARSKGPKG
jgi:hypothetical protein